jgi:putative flippase GtrA
MILAIALLESRRFITSEEPADSEKLLINLASVLMAALMAYLGLCRFAGMLPRDKRNGSPAMLARWLVLACAAMGLHLLLLLALLQLTAASWVVCESAALGVMAVSAYIASRRWVFC